MPPFTPFTGPDNTTLTSALLAQASGIVVSPASITLHESGADAVNFYDGSLAPLGIGSGLLLTSGTTPGTTNTVGWFGQDNSAVSGFANGDPNIDAVVNTVFKTQSYDATTLSFDFTASDPTATSVSFDVVFGSDEFPEWVDQFVDCAIVMVNGVDYALFNHDPTHPLSVISGNVAAGYFQDNAGNVLPIEYDGVSHVLKIVAPINQGVSNHIEIGIADTGDHIYDSGIFLANFAAGTIPGSGVVVTPTVGTEGADNVTGSAQDEYFNMKAGDDTVYAGGGDDIVAAGNGNDAIYGGSGNDQILGGPGNDTIDGGDGTDTAVYSGASTDYSVTVTGAGFTITDNRAGPNFDGQDTLTNVEQAQFSDGLFAIGAGGTFTPVANPAVPPANTPGSVTIGGIAAAGNSLTATVNDPDGITGTVSYQWRVSSDNGLNWTNTGTDSASYAVTSADSGGVVDVVASYTDKGSNAEAPVSATKVIQKVGEGDLLVTLMHLDAPTGASTINPLTTLVKAAIGFDLSPALAAVTIRTVLGLPVDIDLQSYDPYAVLQTDPSQPVALTVEKVAVEVAILTSLSDDDKATNLALKIIGAAAANHTLNLSDANDLATILGVDISGIPNKNNYPQPLREIFDRNSNIAQSAAVSGIETEWQDFLTLQNNIASTSIADLSIHVNQAPVGIATASFANDLQNTPYIVTSGALLQGFSDPESNPLTVTGLSADKGGVSVNGDGTFTIAPATNYVGPVELTYTVSDGLGGVAAASQLFAVVACFAAGTRIETETGEVAVEDLRVGQRLITHDCRREPIVWIGSRAVSCRRHPRPQTVWPVRVRAGTFGGNVPARDLYLSPDHAVFLNGVLVPVKLLVNRTTIAQVERDRVTYYHVELPRHAVILADKLTVESYLDLGDRASFNQGGDLTRLFPNYTSRLAADAAMAWETRGAAPLVLGGEKLEQVRRRIHDRMIDHVA